MEPNQLTPSHLEQQSSLEIQTNEFDYSKRPQWLRAAILGASNGLVSTASLMMGVGAVKHDIKAVILTGIAELATGACSMAISEFISVSYQVDFKLAQMRRRNLQVQGYDNDDEEKLPNPFQAAAASALAFSVGGMVPLLPALFIGDYKVAVVTLALGVFGWLGAVLGKASPMKPTIKVLVGGWLAMAITFGLTKLMGAGGVYV